MVVTWMLIRIDNDKFASDTGDAVAGKFDLKRNLQAQKPLPARQTVKAGINLAYQAGMWPANDTGPAA